MKETATPSTLCPHCGAKLNKATHIEYNVEPKPGDISVCFTCLKPLIFGDDLILRQLTDKEWFAVCDDEELYNSFNDTISKLRSVKQ